MDIRILWVIPKPSPAKSAAEPKWTSPAITSSPAPHHPVPGFAPRVGDASLKLFDKLKPARPIWRVNWAVTVTDRHAWNGKPSPRGREGPLRDGVGLFCRLLGLGLGK